MRPWTMACLLLLAASPAPAARAHAGENANLAAAELLHAAAPAVADTLQARFAEDYAGLLPPAVALAMAPGVGGSPADAQRQAEQLIAAAVLRIRQRDGALVIRAPEASLRRLAAADQDLIQAASDHDTALCPALLRGHLGDLPAGAVSAAFVARGAALLTAIADGRDQPVAPRQATPADYQDFILTARQAAVDTESWEVLSRANSLGAAPAQLCAAMLSASATLLARHDDVADRLLAARAAGVAGAPP